MATLNFDANTVAPSQSFELMPVHWAQGQIIDSEMKTTKAGTGEYLEMVIEIMGGEFNARKLWLRLNLASQNPKAVEIAKADLSKLCRAIGILQVPESTMLHNIPFDIKIGLEKPREGFEQRNEVKDYATLGKYTQAAGYAAPVSDAHPQQPAAPVQPPVPQQPMAPQPMQPQQYLAPQAVPTPAQPTAAPQEFIQAGPVAGDSKPSWAQ
jgi:hypothetical protein